MSTARWSTPGTVSANLNSGGGANSLANGSTSAFLTTYANGTNLDLYASVNVKSDVHHPHVRWVDHVACLLGSRFDGAGQYGFGRWWRRLYASAHIGGKR